MNSLSASVWWLRVFYSVLNEQVSEGRWKWRENWRNWEGLSDREGEQSGGRRQERETS